MLWSEILEGWENGKIFTYPKRLNGKFHWNTSVLEKNGKVEFVERFKVNPDLPERQNKTSFSEKIEAAQGKEKYVTSFPNLSGDTILVIPMPNSGKSYATISHDYIYIYNICICRIVNVRDSVFLFTYI